MKRLVRFFRNISRRFRLALLNRELRELSIRQAALRAASLRLESGPDDDDDCDEDTDYLRQHRARVASLGEVPASVVQRRVAKIGRQYFNRYGRAPYWYREDGHNVQGR